MNMIDKHFAKTEGEEETATSILRLAASRKKDEPEETHVFCQLQTISTGHQPDRFLQKLRFKISFF